jgi:hypothetical protein
MREVDDFIESLQLVTQEAVQDSIDLLERDGFQLSMPDAKPLGNKLWELRVRTSPAVRILYGFRQGVPILLVGYVKQKSAIPRNILDRAKRIYRALCNY